MLEINVQFKVSQLKFSHHFAPSFVTMLKAKQLSEIVYVDTMYRILEVDSSRHFKHRQTSDITTFNLTLMFYYKNTNFALHDETRG